MGSKSLRGEWRGFKLAWRFQSLLSIDPGSTPTLRIQSPPQKRGSHFEDLQKPMHKTGSNSPLYCRVQGFLGH